MKGLFPLTCSYFWCLTKPKWQKNSLQKELYCMSDCICIFEWHLQAAAQDTCAEYASSAHSQTRQLVSLPWPVPAGNPRLCMCPFYPHQRCTHNVLKPYTLLHMLFESNNSQLIWKLHCTSLGKLPNNELKFAAKLTKPYSFKREAFHKITFKIGPSSYTWYQVTCSARPGGLSPEHPGPWPSWGRPVGGRSALACSCPPMTGSVAGEHCAPHPSTFNNKHNDNTLKFVINTVPCNMESGTQWSRHGPSMSTYGCLARKRQQNKVKLFLVISYFRHIN